MSIKETGVFSKGSDFSGPEISAALVEQILPIPVSKFVPKCEDNFCTDKKYFKHRLYLQRVVQSIPSLPVDSSKL